MTVVLVVGVALVIVAIAVVLVVRGDDRGPDNVFPPVSAADGVKEGVAPDEASVVVIGDSVVDQSSAEIGAQVGGAVSVIGVSGYRTDELLPTIRDALGGDHQVDVAVVMAGYNDVWQKTERHAPLEELMAAVAEASCPVWMLVPTKGPWDLDRAEEFDERVRAAAEEAGVAVETGWRDAVDAGAGPEPDPELVSGDQVHPSPAGRAKVGEVVAAAVDRHCG